MCGIIACFNTDPKKKGKKIEKSGPVNNFIIHQYEDQHKRGTEGFGIIRIDEKFRVEVDRATEPIKFMLDLYTKESKMIIAHHRQPTSTDNKIDQTHPIYVANQMLEHSYLVVHNGVVTNDGELKKKHEALGFQYETAYIEEGHQYPGYKKEDEVKFNDSEAIAIELALFIEGKVHTIGTANNAAYIVVQMDKTATFAQKIFYGHETGALNMAKTRGSLKLSSEGPGNEVETGFMYSFSIDDPDMKLAKKKAPFKEWEPVKSNYLGTSITRDEAADKLFNPDGTIKTTTEMAKEGVSIVRNLPAVDKSEGTVHIDEIADDKYLASVKTRFKEAIKNKEGYEIESSMEEFKEEQLDAASQMLQMYADACTENRTEKADATSYLLQIEGHMKVMQMLVEEAEAESKIAFLRDETDEKAADQKEFVKNWHTHHPTEVKRSFTGFANERYPHNSRDFMDY